MAEFRVHHIRFFECSPKAIHCLAYEEHTHRVALSRSDGSIEIWSVSDNWFQEKVILALPDQSVEALVWQGKQLYSAGLTGYVIKYNLQQLRHQKTCSSNAGPIWCLVSNSSRNKLAAGTEDGCVVLFDTEHGELQYLRAFDKQEGRIFSIAWHVDEEVIVTGGIDSIRLWSVSSGHAIQRLTIGRQEKNKETIVWCIAITSDKTIISGDSRGKTCFWNGRQGTLIMGAQSHKADVLCLDVNPEEDCVFSSGIDPSVVQFELTPVSEESERKMWVTSMVRNQHTHDVRALLVAGKYLASGGVDTNLITNQIVKAKGIKSWFRYSGFPHRSGMHVARNANIIMWNQLDCIDLWKLGHTDKSSDTSGDILPLISKPLKLVCLKCKEGEIIVCSAISSEGNVVAYSEQRMIRINRLTVDDKEFITPKLSLTKVKVRANTLLPAHHMVLTSNGQMLITATCEGSIQLIEVGQDSATLKHTFFSENQRPISLLQVSPDGSLVAAAYEGRQLCVFNTQLNKVVCSLPKYSYQATAIAFSLDGQELVVAYADQMILEYDLSCGEYTDWCKLNKKKFPLQWQKRHSKISHITFNPRNAQQLVLHDEQMFCILDKSVPMSGKDARLYSKSTWNQQDYCRIDKAKTFNICNKYKYLLHMDSLTDDWLVAVERTPLSLTEVLPPVLGIKKFGT